MKLEEFVKIIENFKIVKAENSGLYSCRHATA
jgi:hypothetical protein